MGSRADFHTHSTFSDGRLTPTQLLELAARNGVEIIALTDHDSLEGIPEAAAAARRLGLRLVPGAELSTDIPGDEVHILAHFLDPTQRDLQEYLAHYRAARLDRGQRMVAKLNALGVSIHWERVQEIAAGAAVGRPHVAQALVEAGHVASIPEAFDRYIGRNGPAYAERPKMTPAEAVRFVVRMGGLATLAHPRDMATLEQLLPALVQAGLSGMEVYYQDYDAAAVERLRRLAEAHGLIPLGGSDYHALGNPYEREPGCMDQPLPEESIQRFLALAAQRKLDRLLV